MTEIAGIKIDRANPFLILEAGVNHEGSLDTAYEMIDAAAAAGAQMIKFQSYKAETLASKYSPAYWDTQKEPTTSQFELFKKHDNFGDEEYRKLARRCQQKGILFASTPFDLHFADFLDEFMPVYKVASADITNYPLLRKIAKKNKPILLSTGASYISEIDEALRIIAEAGAEQVALLHCVLEYPTPAEHANLETIPYLKSVFPDVTIGWSDHVSPAHNCLSMLAAWVKGADILEKHYTLDKSLPGNDHYHAMDPDDVREFISMQRYFAAMMGKRDKVVTDGEQNSRKYARRSLVATKNIPAGTTLTEEMMTAKRPGTGISPAFFDIVVGRTVKNDIEEDEIITWEMLS